MKFFLFAIMAKHWKRILSNIDCNIVQHCKLFSLVYCATLTSILHNIDINIEARLQIVLIRILRYIVINIAPILEAIWPQH